MKVILLLVLLIQGQEPIKHAKEMPNMKACEAEAHKFNTTKLPAEAFFAQAGCLRIDPSRQLQGTGKGA